jgi:hypothetical protein
VQWMTANGALGSQTESGKVSPLVGYSRAALYDQIIRKMRSGLPDEPRVAVLFFDLAPEVLLSASAAHPATTADRFGVDTTTIDGRSYALAYCKACNRRIVPGAFRGADLASINNAAADHKCPERDGEIPQS